MMYSSLRSLFPPNARPELQSFAFGVDLHLAPQMLGEAVELLDGRGSKGERIAFELFQHFLFGNTRLS
ncbi:hypothetical protein X743_34990 [Mesorhizobium sp. LNHC252B00]|nr:hypothetical protein X743_34990 [Mesorhizobium sp. LNHC252B00]